MLSMILTCLFTVTVIATVLSLTDSWLRAVNAYKVLKRERALLDAGFIPQVHAHELRLRQPARRTLASAARSRGRRMPLPAIQAAG